MKLNDSVTSLAWAVIYPGEEPTANELVYTLLNRVVEVLEYLRAGNINAVYEVAWDKYDTMEVEADWIPAPTIDTTKIIDAIKEATR